MSAAVVGGGIDPFEADTGENEEINDLISIIFPQNYINFLQFTFSYNKKIFNGWVKQPSPCCAAASLAGALNALGNFHRSDDRALNHLDILYIYECILRRSIEKKKTSFERCLGGSIDELLQLLDAEILQLDQNDKKRKKVIGKLTLVRLIKKIVTEKIGESIVPLQEDSSIPLMPSTYALLAELLAAEENQSTEDNTKEDEQEEELEVDQGEEESDIIDESNFTQSLELPLDVKATAIRPPQPSSTLILIHNTWDWKSSFLDLYKKIAGLQKLQSLRPNTAPIGNWGFISALQYLQDENFLDSQSQLPKISLIMGRGKKTSTNRIKKISSVTTNRKGKKGDSSLSNRPTTSSGSVELIITALDTNEEISFQWSRLYSLFNDQEVALIFHLKNHYALIFAMREWSAVNPETGKVEITREILTAKRGQRPSVWISFKEVREIILSWEGYKIFAVTRDKQRNQDNQDDSLELLAQNIGNIKENIRTRMKEKEIAISKE